MKGQATSRKGQLHAQVYFDVAVEAAESGIGCRAKARQEEQSADPAASIFLADVRVLVCTGRGPAQSWETAMFCLQTRQGVIHTKFPSAHCSGLGRKASGIWRVQGISSQGRIRGESGTRSAKHERRGNSPQARNTKARTRNACEAGASGGDTCPATRMQLLHGCQCRLYVMRIFPALPCSPLC